MHKQYYTAKEVAEIVGASESWAYKTIRRLNDELSKKGYLITPGVINKRYFEERCCYGGISEGPS